MEAVNRVGADYAGLIFWEKSRRAVTREKASRLRRLLAPDIVPVGVFVDAAPQEIAEIAAEGIIRMVQLHGAETEDYMEALRECLRAAGAAIPVMKAYTVREETRIPQILRSGADYILLDKIGRAHV